MNKILEILLMVGVVDTVNQGLVTVEVIPFAAMEQEPEMITYPATLIPCVAQEGMRVYITKNSDTGKTTIECIGYDEGC